MNKMDGNKNKNNTKRFCNLCRMFKTNIIQLKCDHIICENCLETQRLYTTENCILCCCIKWL